MLALTGVQLAQLGQGQIGDGPRAVGGPVHLGVVHGDERSVLAEAQIQSDDVHAATFCSEVRPQGVLRFDTHDPAVTDGEESQGSLASVDGGSPRGCGVPTGRAR